LELVLGWWRRSDTARKQTLLFDIRQNTAKRIDSNHSMTRFPQRFGYLSAAGNRHITFRTIATKQNCYLHDKYFYRFDEKIRSGFSSSGKKPQANFLLKRLRWRTQ
jgi:hypothetical protein